MKKVIAAILLFVAIPAFSQTVSAAAKTSEPVKVSEIDMLKIDNAYKDYQLAQYEAQSKLEPIRQNILALIAAARKSAGLDDSWDFDFAQKKFVKRQAPPEAPKTAPASPAAKK